MVDRMNREEYLKQLMQALTSEQLEELREEAAEIRRRSAATRRKAEKIVLSSQRTREQIQLLFATEPDRGVRRAGSRTR